MYEHTSVLSAVVWRYTKWKWRRDMIPSTDSRFFFSVDLLSPFHASPQSLYATHLLYDLSDEMYSDTLNTSTVHKAGTDGRRSKDLTVEKLKAPWMDATRMINEYKITNFQPSSNGFFNHCYHVCIPSYLFLCKRVYVLRNAAVSEAVCQRYAKIWKLRESAWFE